MKVCGDTLCAKPGKRQSLKDFPVNKARRDGRHLYCRKCCARRAFQTRADKKAQRLAQDATPLPARKACQRAVEARKRILEAIRGGYGTRMAIKRHTKLELDEVCDMLAELLFDDRLVRLQTVNGERRFVA